VRFIRKVVGFLRVNPALVGSAVSCLGEVNTATLAWRPVQVPTSLKALSQDMASRRKQAASQKTESCGLGTTGKVPERKGLTGLRDPG